MKAIRPWLIAGMLTVTTIYADAAPVIYTDEAAYIRALSTGGYGTLHEGFENNVVWADSRSTISNPASTPQVNSQGIIWTSNLATNDIATGSVGVGGSFGFYSIPHGNPDVEWRDSVCDVPDPIPEQCFLHDGFVGNSEGAGTLYGVGGWINGTLGADVTLFLDAVEVNFGAASNISSWTFLGVIDTAGFNSFEFREINGTGGQTMYIYADDFTFGVSAVPVQDFDADGVADLLDNCTDVQNAGQQDTDSDGYGNICDGDLNNTGGVVNFEDLALFKLAFGTSGSAADFDSSGGVVNFGDMANFKQLFGSPPGPSCCGTLSP
ncbi:MAG: hypothetical protein U9P00_01435 [Pseudomonadota bacterium]|nr:hypothetical protein [Pseudomonadota bacterium]